MPAPRLHAEREPDYIYVIYIVASPQKIWDALTDATTERAWWAGTRQDSTFEVGAPIVFRRKGKIDLRGEILESVPPVPFSLENGTTLESRAPNWRPGRLVYTFHIEEPGPAHDEGPSIVTYDIKTSGGSTMLKVTHSNFPKGSLSRAGVEHGWPAIFSGLKTVLEGGKMPDFDDWGEDEFKRAQAEAAKQK